MYPVLQISMFCFCYLLFHSFYSSFHSLFTTHIVQDHITVAIGFPQKIISVDTQVLVLRFSGS